MNLYQLEVREAATEDGAEPAPWRSLPLYPADGETLDLSHLPFRDGTYDFRVRMVPDDGPPSEWTYIPGLEVTGQSEEVLPPPPTGLRVDRSSCLAWDLEDRPLGLAGFLARYALGDRRVWEEGIPIGPGVVDNPPLPTCGVPHGVVTFMVRAVDIYGNLSAETAFLLVDRGPLDEALPVLDAARADGGGLADTWPGELVGVMTLPPPGLVNILEGAPSSLLWTHDARPLWSGDDSRPLWGERFEDLIYTLSYGLLGQFVPEEVAPLGDGELLSLGFVSTEEENARAAGGTVVEVRTHEAPLWSGNDNAPLWKGPNSRLLWERVSDTSPLWTYDAAPLWAEDDTTPLWKQARWRPWPGKVERPTRQPYDLRFTVPGGRRRPELRSLRLPTSSAVPVPTVAAPQGLATDAAVLAAIAAAVAGIPTSGRFSKVTVLSGGSGTFVDQPTTTVRIVDLWGGGGGGGGANGAFPPGSLAAAAGAGAAGAYCRKVIVGPASSYAYTVGAFGAGGGGGPGAAGGAGGATTFGTLTAPGGGGGVGSLGVLVDGFVGGGVSGLATGGDINGQGDPGGGGMVYGGATVAVGGKGGSSSIGSGGDQVNNGPGLAAGGRAAGGGGGGSIAPAPPSPGGAGTAGLIVVYEFS